ncbi:MAG: hypothetical protein HFI75_10250 [Lachnospiraceae bacterium]|nr:hypothetical protein [Lachnospiraceae bacterium]
MANLVKFNCVIQEEDKRIIDSDVIIADKLKSLSNVSSYVEGEDYDDEFAENISKDKVERLLEDREEAIINDAQEKKQEIIEQANAEASFIIEKARKEGESMRIQSYAKGEKEGYEAGYEKGMNQVEEMKRQLQASKIELEEQYQKQLEEMEPVLVDALIGILESAFSIEFAEKKNFILHLLQSAFSKIENSKEYLIRVSREDYPMVQEQKEEIREELPRSAAVEVVEDLTLAKNQCLIETDGGLFDCSLDTQMDSLIRDLRMLSSM